MRARVSAHGYLRGALLAAGSAGALLALAGINSSIRGPAVLLFLVAAPALAVAGLLRGLDPVVRVVVAVTAAIAVNVLVAQAMLTAGAWSPRAGLVAMAVISVIIGAIGLRVPRGRPGRPVPAWAGRLAGRVSGRSGRR